MVQESVSIFKVNRNAAVVIDSDKRAEGSQLNNTKERMIREVQDIGGLAWITKGREIENYISREVVATWLKKDKAHVNQVGQYDDFFDYLNGLDGGKGDHFRGQKPVLAELIASHMTKENIGQILDLAKRLDELCVAIRRWNNIKQPAVGVG